MTRKTKNPHNAGKDRRTNANNTDDNLKPSASDISNITDMGGPHTINANNAEARNTETTNANASTTPELITNSSPETAITISSMSYQNNAASAFESLRQQITPGRRYAECRNRLVRYRNSVFEYCKRNAKSCKRYVEHYNHRLISDLLTSYGTHALTWVFSTIHWEEFFAFVRGHLAGDGVGVDNGIEHVQADEKDDGQKDEIDLVQGWLEECADMTG